METFTGAFEYSEKYVLGMFNILIVGTYLKTVKIFNMQIFMCSDELK